VRVFLLLACLVLVRQLSVAATGKFGTVSFPISCSSAVRPEFEEGIALLHSFQYALAASSFSHVATKDPQCAMAYWGQAMALYHQLWTWPDEKTLAKGHEFVKQAISAEAKTPREREYINAAAEFYQVNRTMGTSARVAAYSAAMANLYHRYHQDSEAAAFYALSRLAMDHVGIEGARMEAISILADLLKRKPRHPGAAHYLIHATDTPELAPLGLTAARRYAEIAPASAHALHMPSHIFSQLGFWQDSINSNRASMEAAAQATLTGVDNQSGYQLHAMKFLEYAYLQMGNDRDANRLLEEVSENPGIARVDIINDGSIMRALYLIETHDWEGAARLPVQPDAVPLAKIRIHWARAMGEVHQRNLDAARTDLQQLRSAFAELQKDGSNSAPENAESLEVEAWIAYAEDRKDEAVERMRTATKEDSFDINEVGLPASEQLGDLMSELRQFGPALEAYKATLKVAPNRFNSLYGAARAAEHSDKPELAKSYYLRLIATADTRTKRPEFRLATAFLGEPRK